MAGTADIVYFDGTPTNGANPWIDSLVWGGAWRDSTALPTSGGPVTISFAAMNGLDPYGAFSGSAMTWSATATSAVSRALGAWSAVANVEFKNVTATPYSADVWIWQNTNSQIGGYLGTSEVPTNSAFEPLYVNFNAQHSSWSSSGLATGGYGYVTLLHEFGHLLGLAHPHDGGSDFDATTFPGVSSAFGDYGDYDLNQGIFTVMSYNDGWDSNLPGVSNAFGWEASPMALDIAAIQKIYGANTSYATGNNSYVLPKANAAGTYWSCIWDAGGTDAITNAGASAACVINLNAAPLVGANAGGYISANAGIIGGFTIAAGVTIENATGGNGADHLTGNGAVNTLTGNSGNDTLNGGAGADKLLGGAGGDVYYVENVGDVITEAVNAGTDLVYAARTWTLAANVEHLTLSGSSAINGTGNTLNNRIVGNTAANTLSGAAGNDTLDGAGGADNMAGGAGNDAFYVDASGDLTTEAANGGYDTVHSSVTRVLSGHIERLVLTGSGSTHASGNTLANYLIGNSNANGLNGSIGADTMAGGFGDDTYYVDNAGDVTIEASVSGGVDRVVSSVSRTLDANFEHLTLSGAAGIHGTGNTLANSISGNTAANVINGGAGNDTLNGAGGRDTLIGGEGDDRFYVETIGDVTSEALNQGTDTVYSNIAWMLSANIENLVLYGASSIAGTGNSLNNTLIGNDAANTLTGGNGDDTLNGGAGADSLIAGAGEDVITGGLGDDILTGGLGGDTFVFSTALGAGNIDQITDFSSGIDLIHLSDAIFNALGAPGSVDAAEFVIGSAAADADDFLIYDSATGALLYDADGDGNGAAAIQFAALNIGLSPTASDFQII